MSTKPSAKEVYEAFKPFYDKLIEFVDLLRNKENLCYQNADTHYIKRGRKLLFNKRYRAVFGCSDSALHSYQGTIDELERLYTQAAEQLNAKHDNTKEITLPVYIPRIKTDFYKMQLHVNKAHSSERFEKPSYLPVLSTSGGTIGNEDETNADIQAHKESLEKEGYDTRIVRENKTEQLQVSVESICNIHNCDSVQLRQLTGKQIRASFFSLDEHNQLQKSKMETLGILLVHRGAQILKSHERSRRIDAKYTKQHPDEIILVDDSDLVTGRFYKNYK